jgi:hypothetical protein
MLGGGKLLLLTTPRGKTGTFYELWSSPSPEWHRINAKAADLKRLSCEQLARMREGMTEREWAQEFDNQFLEAEDAVFTEEAVQKLLEIDPPEYALPAVDLEAVWHEYVRRR